jgi:hypothetical protein
LIPNGAKSGHAAAEVVEIQHSGSRCFNGTSSRSRDPVVFAVPSIKEAKDLSSSRLVVVSNRVAFPAEGAQRSGGLVTGLIDALHQRGGLWFGWSGKLGEGQSPPVVFDSDGVTYATVDLTRADHSGYYSGFSNAALWPLLHYRLDLVILLARTWRLINASMPSSQRHSRLCLGQVTSFGCMTIT